jgi:type IV secretory pathway TrbD component
MTPNIGNTDRLVRFGLGLVLLVVALATQTWWVLIFTALLWVTAAIRWCPAYLPFRFSTLRRDNA